MREIPTTYFISTVLLAALSIAFFALGGGTFQQFGRTQWLLRIVTAVPLVVSSIGHFSRTATYATIVPPIFPHPNLWVLFTGILELAGALGLLVPSTAKAAAAGVVLLMIAVFPANIYGANQNVGGLHMPGVPLRLAIQAIYISLVLLAGWGIPGSRHPAGRNP